jgi:hypothetical protein
MLFISWEVIQPKNTVQLTHIFPFLAPTPCLMNVGKRLDNFEFSEKNFRSHGGRGKILKVMKAQANRAANKYLT